MGLYAAHAQLSLPGSSHLPITRLELSLNFRETIHHENHEQTKCFLKASLDQIQYIFQ